MKNKNAVIIVAGGKGTRMGSQLPKQYLCLGHQPILMHTIELFYRFDPLMTRIVVLPKADHKYWEELCKKYDFKVPHLLTSGGDTRFHSVRNGLKQITEECYVGVHDGVRPFVSEEVIKECYQRVRTAEAVIPVTPVFESLRSLSKNVAVDRSDYCLVQTPQVFQVEVLRRAYEQPFNRCFTDDASVVEAAGGTVSLVEGNRENIKMTTPFDLKIGELLLND